MTNQLQVQSEKLAEFQLARLKDFSTIKPGLLTEDEVKIIKINSEFPLLKNIEKEKQEEATRQMIAVVCGLLGIKTLPDQLVLPIVMRFIRDNFGSLTCQGMIHAFELNALGKLSKNHEHFQCFSIEFIGGVLGDYLNLKRKTIIDFKKISAPKEIFTQPSDIDNYNWLCDFIKKNNCFPVSFNWNSVFIHMKESGLANESNEWMKEFKEQIAAKMKSEIKDEKMKVGSAIERLNIDNAFNEESLNNRCRKEYVFYKLKPESK